MIKVSPRGMPKVLRASGSPAAEERFRAINFFHDPKNRDTAFEGFRVYKNSAVIAALERKFCKKCAYCESPYRATQPVDVEHYRPKGGVVIDRKLTKPGYYWLAASWRNLLPSCIDCNRARTQESPDADPHLSGKANQFPITDESKRANAPGDEEREGRLLLHPYLDEPDEHLEFRDQGEVFPKPDEQGLPSPMAVVSIDVYGLNRLGLLNARASRQADIHKDIVMLKRQVLVYQRYSDDPDILIQLQALAAKVKGYRIASSPYAAMARQTIDPQLAELGIPTPD